MTLSDVKKSKHQVLYFKNNHCPPCKVLRPKIESLINTDFPKLEFVIVDSIKNPELCSEFNVYANPTILVFLEGKEYIRKSKYVSVSQFKGELNRLYTMMFE